jgi:methylated-DNA-[protein]-cysteine S-methyltransferase
MAFKKEKPVSRFAQQVYEVVMSIPAGETRTYKEVAELAGSPKAYQAVGQILKRNPNPLMIPCHRVVGKSTLGGYFGAKNRALKIQLLNAEKKKGPIKS